MGNKYHEVYNPRPDKEYWVVIDETYEMPHYFKTQENAKKYAKAHGHEIIFQECFN